VGFVTKGLTAQWFQIPKKVRLLLHTDHTKPGTRL